MNAPRADRLQTFAWTAAALAIAGLFWLLGPILTPFVIAAVFACLMIISYVPQVSLLLRDLTFR